MLTVFQPDRIVTAAGNEIKVCQQRIHIRVELMASPGRQEDRSRAREDARERPSSAQSPGTGSTPRTGLYQDTHQGRCLGPSVGEALVVTEYA